MIQRTYERCSFSARAYNSILKVARTSADLRGTAEITIDDVRVALMARDLDKDSEGVRF